MGVNILQIFKGSFVLKKSPSSDMQWVCLVLGDKTNGYFLVLCPQFIFPLGHVFSFKYWNALRWGFLCSLFTGNGSIEFPFGKLLNVNDIMGSNFMNQGSKQLSFYEPARTGSSLSYDKCILDNTVPFFEYPSKLI